MTSPSLEEKVLIVDDDTILRNLSRQHLLSMGFDDSNIYDADTIQEATRILDQDQDIAITLVDLCLRQNYQDRSGYDVLKHIRESEHNTVSLVMSGIGNMDDVKVAKDFGALDCLQKPFGEDMFKEKIRKARNIYLFLQPTIKDRANEIYQQRIDDTEESSSEQQTADWLQAEQEIIKNILLFSPQDRPISEALKTELDIEGYKVTYTGRLNELQTHLAVGKQDVVLCVDLTSMVEREDGLNIVRELKEKYSQIPVIVISETDDTQFAVDMMKVGADDYKIIRPAKEDNTIPSDQFTELTDCIEKALVGRERESVIEPKERYHVLVSMGDGRTRNEVRNDLESVGYDVADFGTLEEACNEINKSRRPFDLFITEYDPQEEKDDMSLRAQEKDFQKKLQTVRKVYGKEDLALLVVRSAQIERNDSTITSMDLGVRHILATEHVGKRDYTLPFVENAINELGEKKIWDDERIRQEESKVIANLFALGTEEADSQDILQRIQSRLDLITAKAPGSNFAREGKLSVYCRLLDYDGNVLEEVTEQTVSTQRVHVLREDPGIGKGVYFKQHSEPRRADIEASASRFIKKHNNKERETRHWIEDHAFPTLPIINSSEVIKSRSSPKHNFGYTLTGMIRGPRMTSLAQEMNYEIERGNQEAIEFKRRVVFETNKYLAFFQTVQIPLPDDVEPVHIDFGEDLQRTLKDNLAVLKIGLSQEEAKDIGQTISILYKNLEGCADTQYFDFNWSNLLLDTGDENSSFREVLKQRRSQKISIGDFVRINLDKIDWCKIDRKTSALEDRRHESSQVRFSPEERKFYDFHFLCYRRKFSLIVEFRNSDNPALLGELRQLETLILDLENSGEAILNREQLEEDPLTADLLRDLSKYNQNDELVSMYRHIRWFDHTLNKYLVRSLKRKDEAWQRIIQCVTIDGKSKFLSELDETRYLDQADAIEAVIGKYFSKYQERTFIRTRKKFRYDVKNRGFHKFIGRRISKNVFVDAVNNYMDAAAEQNERHEDMDYYIGESIRLMKEKSAALREDLNKNPTEEYTRINDLSARLREGDSKGYMAALLSVQDKKVQIYGAVMHMQVMLEKINGCEVNYNRLQHQNKDKNE